MDLARLLPVARYFKYQHLYYNKLAVGLPILLSPHPHPLTTDLCASAGLTLAREIKVFHQKRQDKKQDVRTEE